jgi:hypothetical protein
VERFCQVMVWQQKAVENRNRVVPTRGEVGLGAAKRAANEARLSVDATEVARALRVTTQSRKRRAAKSEARWRRNRFGGRKCGSTAEPPQGSGQPFMVCHDVLMVVAADTAPLTSPETCTQRL